MTSSSKLPMYDEGNRQIRFPCIRIQQPIGEYYVGVIDSKLLCEITDFDIRRIYGDQDIETYLGIQRKLSNNRLKELSKYVNTVDACFPTSVILAVSRNCAAFVPESNEMIFQNYLPEDRSEKPVYFRYIAKVLDGQHRIKGLESYTGENFQINVSIFVDADIAEQAYIFSTVNLAQTKVNKSLVYDLFDYAKSRSPQKLCHNVAVALDQNEGSPFYKRIKRLGTAVPGKNEKITQATFVEALMRYISKDPISDRDIYMRNKTPSRASNEDSATLIFRDLMIDNRDEDLVDIIWNFFDAVKRKWKDAWESNESGMILNRSNGFQALMRFLGDLYLEIETKGKVVSTDQFFAKIEPFAIESKEFTSDNFLPGSTGQSSLYQRLIYELKN